MDPTRLAARPYPDGVPILLDAEHGVKLRPHVDADLAPMLEMGRDPEMVRWINLPGELGQLQPAGAEEYRDRVRAGWQSGQHLGWAIEADRAGPSRFCGNIDLRVQASGLGDIGYALHPAARGRGIMTAALRLVCDFGFETVGLRAIRWRATVGNWPSRRVAARAGFVVDGTVRHLIEYRGELRDGWVATLARDDPRTPVPWLEPAELRGATVVLRPFRETDIDRIIEACSDERTRHWLVSLPRPYTRDDALSYLEATRELAARCTGIVWCVADATSGLCLGAISLEGLGTYAPRGEIGYWAHPDARGRGVITEAVRLVTRHAEQAGLARSIAIRCAAENRASRYAASAAGYREVGVLKAAEPLGDGTLSDLVLYAHP
jgi:RimJ/RimL family protein N-acetyltransferase